MKFQPRFSDMTGEQEQKEQRYHEAVKVLQRAGFDAEYIKTFVDKPSDEPGYIHLTKD